MLAKITVGNFQFNVLSAEYSFRQLCDFTGRPISKTVFSGLRLILEASKSNYFIERVIHPTQKTNITLEFISNIRAGKTRKIHFIDSHIVRSETTYAANGITPMTETIDISSAGVKDSNFKTEYSANWRETFPSDIPIIIEEKTILIKEEEKISQKEEIPQEVEKEKDEDEVKIPMEIVFGTDGRDEKSIKKAYDIGYRYFDSADSYAISNPVLAKLSNEANYNDIKIIYKLSEELDNLESRIKELKNKFNDKIEFLIVHNTSYHISTIEEIWKNLKGSNKKIGLGNLTDKLFENNEDKLKQIYEDNYCTEIPIRNVVLNEEYFFKYFQAYMEEGHVFLYRTHSTYTTMDLDKKIITRGDEALTLYFRAIAEYFYNIKSSFQEGSTPIPYIIVSSSNENTIKKNYVCFQSAFNLKEKDKNERYDHIYERFKKILKPDKTEENIKYSPEARTLAGKVGNSFWIRMLNKVAGEQIPNKSDIGEYQNRKYFVEKIGEIWDTPNKRIELKILFTEQLDEEFKEKKSELQMTIYKGGCEKDNPTWRNKSFWDIMGSLLEDMSKNCESVACSETFNWVYLDSETENQTS